MTRSLEDVVWKGDITPEVKDGIRQFMEAGASRPTFAPSVSARAVPKEIEVFKREKDGKAQARVVYEMKVEDGASVPAIELGRFPMSPLPFSSQTC